MDIQTFNFSVDLLRAILWQYTSATNLQGILNAKNTWYIQNQTDFWNDWLTDVFDLRTANSFGLSVWSMILGQPIFTNFGPVNPTNAFGFTSNHKNFDNGNFGSVTGGNRVYTPTVARLLLQIRYFQLISSGTVPETNRLLKYLFAEDYGLAYLVDNHDMSQTYYFEFVIPSEIRYMLDNTDVLPRPAGVKSTIVGL